MGICHRRECREGQTLRYSPVKIARSQCNVEQDRSFRFLSRREPPQPRADWPHRPPTANRRLLLILPLYTLFEPHRGSAY